MCLGVAVIHLSSLVGNKMFWLHITYAYIYIYPAQNFHRSIVSTAHTHIKHTVVVIQYECVRNKESHCNNANNFTFLAKLKFKLHRTILLMCFPSWVFIRWHTCYPLHIHILLHICCTDKTNNTVLGSHALVIMYRFVCFSIVFFSLFCCATICLKIKWNILSKYVEVPWLDRIPYASVFILYDDHNKRKYSALPPLQRLEALTVPCDKRFWTFNFFFVGREIKVTLKYTHSTAQWHFNAILVVH